MYPYLLAFQRLQQAAALQGLRLQQNGHFMPEPCHRLFDPASLSVAPEAGLAPDSFLPELLTPLFFKVYCTGRGFVCRDAAVL
jgi:hypothetical protein